VLKRHSQLFVSILVVIDVVVVAAAWTIATLLVLMRKEPTNPLGPFYLWYLPMLPAVVVSYLVAYRLVGLYRPRREQSLLTELGTVAVAGVVGMFIALAAIFFQGYGSVLDRHVVGLLPVVSTALTFGSRMAIRSVLRALRRRGWNQRRVLVVGAGKLGQALVDRIRHNTWMGFQVVGYVDDDPARAGKTFLGVPVIGTIDHLDDLLAEHAVDEIFCALPFEKFPDLQNVLNHLDVATVNVRIVPDLFGFATLHSRIGDFDGLPVVSLRESPLYGWNRLLKRGMDLVVGAVLLVVFGLPMLVIALVVRLTSRGPAIFRQERASLDGTTFPMLKFRTMRVGAEARSGPVWAEEGDPRATRVGRFLRRTSLDELPQVLNVIRGDMSLVGPRPERPVFIERFKHDIPKYMLRHKMKTGLTGWAQINGWRGNTSLEKRIQYDLYYIENWSLWFDLRILLLTPFKGLIHRHAY